MSYTLSSFFPSQHKSARRDRRQGSITAKIISSGLNDDERRWEPHGPPAQSRVSECINDSTMDVDFLLPLLFNQLAELMSTGSEETIVSQQCKEVSRGLWGWPVGHEEENLEIE